MALDKTTFETINPSRFTTFTFPNPSNSATLLRVAVLDSPFQLADRPRVAAMLVPNHRESDWIFSTESGHLQLLLSSPGISRLILVGNQPIDGHHSSAIYNPRPAKNDTSYDDGLGVSLKPLFIALSPKSSFKFGIPEIPILSYEDNVVRSVVLERYVGDLVGEMVVEDMEIESGDNGVSKREFRRRLRFKRMPNLVQTEVRIVPKIDSGLDCVEIGQVEFVPDNSVLVHPYLVPMVASLRLIASYIDARIRNGFRPKALCLGVGGGALLGFLRAQLGFEVVGVEADKGVLDVSRKYFGLEDGDNIKIYVGDAIEVMEKLASQGNRQSCTSFGADEIEDGCDMGNGNDIGSKFDLLLVDLDSSDAGDGIIAPPFEFVRKHVLLSARSVLSDNGLLAINVVPPNRSFYTTMIHEFREVFPELYEIDVGNGENFILIAILSPVTSSTSDSENGFLIKLKVAISGAYLNSIQKV